VALTGIQSATLSRTNILVLQAVSDNPSLVGNITIDYTFPDSTGILKFTTPGDALGTATITVALSDGLSDQSFSTRTFKVTVNPPVVAPLVQWVTPTNRAVLEYPQPTALQATASDPDGAVVSVEFRDGTNSLGVVSSPPYSLLWSNPTVGSHTLCAVATDDRGSTTTSAVALLTVLPLNQAPTAQWLSPANNGVLQNPQPVMLEVAANDSDGTIARVEFLDGTNSLGVLSEPPYSLLWTNPTVGTHILSAVATDDREGTATSAVALLTVLPLNQAPTVQWLNPATNSVLQNPQPVILEVAAGDFDGTIVRVEFQDGTNSLGVLSNPPYSLLLTNATVGTHVLSAVATDNRGATTFSDVALLTVLPLNQAPSVEWLSPANNSVLQNPQSISLQVTPTDFDGTIARVEFREGANTLGAVSSPPYSLLWTNPTAGTHTFSAVVTDNRGGAALSDLISVTITAPSTNEIPLTIRSAQFVAFQGSPVTKSALDPGNSQFQFQIEGPDGSTVVVEASSDLRTWAPISTNTLVNGAALSTDTESPRPEIRHYRVRLSSQAP
jgi:hypothetical protein